jgi:hypothetical protein
MDASISGANELPNASTRFDDVSIGWFVAKKTYALMKVNASNPIPVKSVI